jgi:hypothetical protein
LPNHRRRLAVVVASALLAAGCGGRDAVAQGGAFDFVSPGGKVDILYDPPASRGTIGDLTGPDLVNGHPIHVSDHSERIVVINVGDGKALRIFVNGTQVTANPAAVILNAHDEIALIYGNPQSAGSIPSRYDFPSGL